MDMLIRTTSEVGYSDDRVFGLVQQPQNCFRIEGGGFFGRSGFLSLSVEDALDGVGSV